MKYLTDLRQIPGVGPSIEQDLLAIGIKLLADLRGKDPQQLYEADAAAKGHYSDRCVLYVFRLAVYFAENDVHEPEKLKWWYWQDKNPQESAE